MLCSKLTLCTVLIHAVGTIPIRSFFKIIINMSETKQEGIDRSSKKPFNKKKWREQRYSCKAKVQKWENIKRKQIQRQYLKELKKSNFIPNDGNKLIERQPQSSFKQAQLQYKAIQQQKEEKRKEQERIRKEKIEAIKAYKEKRAARFKKLSQKTRKGQPLMRGRIELLLEKIQKEFVNHDS